MRFFSLASRYHVHLFTFWLTYVCHVSKHVFECFFSLSISIHAAICSGNERWGSFRELLLPRAAGEKLSFCPMSVAGFERCRGRFSSFCEKKYGIFFSLTTVLVVNVTYQLGGKGTPNGLTYKTLGSSFASYATVQHVAAAVIINRCWRQNARISRAAAVFENLKQRRLRPAVYFPMEPVLCAFSTNSVLK